MEDQAWPQPSHYFTCFLDCLGITDIDYTVFLRTMPGNRRVAAEERRPALLRIQNTLYKKCPEFAAVYAVENTWKLQAVLALLAWQIPVSSTVFHQALGWSEGEAVRCLSELGAMPDEVMPITWNARTRTAQWVGLPEPSPYRLKLDWPGKEARYLKVRREGYRYGRGYQRSYFNSKELLSNLLNGDDELSRTHFLGILWNNSFHVQATCKDGYPIVFKGAGESGRVPFHNSYHRSAERDHCAMLNGTNGENPNRSRTACHCRERFVVNPPGSAPKGESYMSFTTCYGIRLTFEPIPAQEPVATADSARRSPPAR